MRTNLRLSLANSQILHEARLQHATNLHKNLNGQSVMKQIEHSDTPSQKYKDVIKDVFREQLHTSLLEYQQKKIKTEKQKQQFSKAYLNDCYENRQMIENNTSTRKKHYELISQQQSERAQDFIDATKIHENRILTHADTNLDPKMFHHFQERYDEQTVEAKRNLRNTLDSQIEDHRKQKSEHREQKGIQIENRLRIMQQIHQQERKDQEIKIQRKNEYKSELDRLVAIKSNHVSADTSSYSVNRYRHNPITNPIDFHVENPYLVKRIVQNNTQK